MIAQIHHYIIPAAYDLLPPKMHSPAATAMLLAIGLQESRFEHRHQVNGPARGFWQFEKMGGIRGVLTHPLTSGHAAKALRDLKYVGASESPEAVYAVLAHNDTLAAVFARLLLWTVPGALPNPGQSAFGWRVYIDGWRPGKPHPETWRPFFDEAWAMVLADGKGNQ